MTGEPDSKEGPVTTEQQDTSINDRIGRALHNADQNRGNSKDGGETAYTDNQGNRKVVPGGQEEEIAKAIKDDNTTPKGTPQIDPVKNQTSVKGDEPVSKTVTPINEETPKERLNRINQSQEEQRKNHKKLEEASSEIDAIVEKPDSQTVKVTTKPEKPVSTEKKTEDDKPIVERLQDIEKETNAKLGLLRKETDYLRRKLRETQDRLKKMEQDSEDIKSSISGIKDDQEQVQDPNKIPVIQGEPVDEIPGEEQDVQIPPPSPSPDQVAQLQKRVEDQDEKIKDIEKREQERNKKNRRLLAIISGVAIGALAVATLPAATCIAIGGYALLGAGGAGRLGKWLGKKLETATAKEQEVVGHRQSNDYVKGSGIDDYLTKQEEEARKRREEVERWWKIFDTAAYFLTGLGASTLIGGILRGGLAAPAARTTEIPAQARAEVGVGQPAVEAAQTGTNIPDVTNMESLNMLKDFGWNVDGKTTLLLNRRLGGDWGIAQANLLKELRSAGVRLQTTDQGRFFDAIRSMIFNKATSQQAAAQFLR